VHTHTKKKTVIPTSTPAAAEPLLIELWPVARPIPYPKNARIVSARAVETLSASIREFGWRQPIVVDINDVIIMGHTRLLAAKALGRETVPVHIATTLTPAQVKSLRLMDNRSADETEWDIPLVEAEILELQTLDYDLSLTGFTEEEVAVLFAGGQTEADAVPAVPETPVSRAGDLWILGGPTCPHCGTVN
jgi:ParB-like chromosome segregation protein Spo0J